MNTKAKEFLKYYARIRERTERVIACIPPDKLEWSHQVGKFTFGDLIRHLAGAERYMFSENAQCKPSRYPGHGPELAEGYDAVVEYLRRLHIESVEIVSGLTDEQMELRCDTPGGVRITVWKWLRAMVEHEVHHRGQIYMMLGVVGVETPPLYGLTEEEVIERSVVQNDRNAH